MALPDDQGFHEEIQFILFGTHLWQCLCTEGEAGRRRGMEGVLALSIPSVSGQDVSREPSRARQPRSAQDGAASYLYSHLQGAWVAGHSRHLTFIHLPKSTMAQTPVQRRRQDRRRRAGRERGPQRQQVTCTLRSSTSTWLCCAFHPGIQNMGSVFMQTY